MKTRISNIQKPRTASILAGELNTNASEYNAAMVKAAGDLIQTGRGGAGYLTSGAAGTVWRHEGDTIILAHEGGA